MGQEGKTYNILSDKGLQYNAKFAKPSNNSAAGDKTVIDKAGITSGKDKLEFDHGGAVPQLNGKDMEKGKDYTLDNGGKATWDGTALSFNNKEYNINLSEDPNDSSALLSKVKVNDGVNPLADGVSPHGLLGQTADGVAGDHKGANNTNVENQGGTVIDGTVNQYEVSDLFDTGFKQFNKFNG